METKTIVLSPISTVPASASGQTTGHSVDRSFRETMMNEVLKLLVLWIAGCQDDVAEAQVWRREKNIAQGDDLVAALDILFLANMDGCKFGSSQVHKVELDKGEGNLRGTVLAAFTMAMAKPRDLPGKK